MSDMEKRRDDDVRDAAMEVLRRRFLPLLEAGERPKHYECEDSFYSCPKAEHYFGPEKYDECSCGKDGWDAAKKEALSVSEPTNLERARQLRPKIINARGIVDSEQVIADALDAVEKAALEKAAEVCEQHKQFFRNRACVEIVAAAIRAMKGRP